MGHKSTAELEGILTSITADFSNVTAKKMFGCHALWAKGNVFALVWKHGRIGLKLPDDASYSELIGVTGSEPWKAGPMKMAHWVLVPESFHTKLTHLKSWATKAHDQCSVLEKKNKKPAASKKKVAMTKTKKKKVK